MMSSDITEFKCTATDDIYYKIKHKSGLNIIVFNKPGFASSVASFSVKYGSVDTTFRTNHSLDFRKYPDGVAHFLEHKLFESEDRNAFNIFSEYGASSNAYTSFNTTSYYFLTTRNFYDCLKVLLDFVQSPYFTDDNVKKEQGIIDQEIEMSYDDPDWCVFYNLLKSMYLNHPIKNDIGGTAESIAKITPKMLYECYNTFYIPSNMLLMVTGDVDINQVLEICNNELVEKPSRPLPERFIENEPDKIVIPRIVKNMQVSEPMFELGFKEKSSEYNEKEIATKEIMIDTLASSSSELYENLYNEELINEASYSYGFFEGPGYSSYLLGGETKDPDKTADYILRYIDKIKKEGFSKDDFMRSKKSIYGSNVVGLESPFGINNAVTTFDFQNRNLFRYLDVFSSIDIDDINNEIAKSLDSSRLVQSIILPE
jgi:predicted Zn-dependent peptidase